MNYSQIQQDFQLPYSRIVWSHMISQIFPGAQIWARPDKLTDIDNHAAQEAYKLGQIILDENGIERTISIFEVQLAPGIVLERNRVGLRNLLKKYWRYIDGAFVSYYQPGYQNWRFTYVSELTGWDAEGEQYKIQTEPKRYTYILGETETCRTAAERFAILSEKGRSAGLKDVMDAFSVEKLSKAFFDEYKLHYQKFCDFMLSKPGISTALFSNDDKAIRDFAKKMLGRIVFLYFIQKKGWLGVPVGKSWGEGDPQFLTNLFNLAPFKPLFYSSYLTKLFFDTLNTPRANDEIEIIPGNPCRIPYLNGGLFEEVNPNYREINFPPELFSGLLEFFSHYNFTIYEDDPNDQIIAVDPEMLGHIFENLLEDNKDKGAFYTPKEIVHYMCQESLTEYLATWFEQKGYQVTGYREFAKQDEPLLFPPNEGRIGQQVLEIAADSSDKAIDRLIIENLLKKRLSPIDKVVIIRHADEINKALDNVKICDPAIGSGAFPMGLLHEIYSTKQTLFEFEHGNLEGFDASAIKLKIIQNSIYGVDIEKGAVDIARLRFWLSLIVDEPQPKPLPNLDYKIVTGDSLVAKLKMGETEEIVAIDWGLKPEMHGLFGRELMEQKSNLFKSLIQKQKAHFHPESDKKRLAVEIRNLKIDLLINQLELMVKNKGTEVKPSGIGKTLIQRTELYLQTLGWKQIISQLKYLKADTSKNLLFFDWKLDFPEIMNEEVAGKVGFDIVVGNPPYINIKRGIENKIKIQYQKCYETATGQFDLFALFIELSLNIGNLLSFIVPKPIINNENYETARRLILKRGLSQIVLGSGIFENAGVESCIFISSKSTDPRFKVFEFSNNLFKLRHFIPLSFINMVPYSMFTTEIEIESLSIYDKLECDVFHLSELLDITRGIEAGKSDECIIDTPNEFKLLRGEDISRYKYEFENIYCLYDGFNLSKFKPLKLYSDEKIFIRRVANELIATYDKNKYLVLNSVYCGTRKSPSYSLKYILAIINSRLIHYWFRNIFILTDKLFPYIRKSQLEFIPVKKCNNQGFFINKVDNILFLKSEDKDSSSFEQQIDHMVYKLYDLTYDEVKMVDPDFPLSKAEYSAIMVE